MNIMTTIGNFLIYFARSSENNPNIKHKSTLETLKLCSINQSLGLFRCHPYHVKENIKCRRTY